MRWITSIPMALVCELAVKGLPELT